jgi:hypothetical protein
VKVGEVGIGFHLLTFRTKDLFFQIILFVVVVVVVGRRVKS